MYRTRFIYRKVVWAIGLSAVSLSCFIEDAERPRTLVVARPGDALTLDPAAITDVESMQVTAQVLETLVRYQKGTNEVEPALATRWEVSSDGTLWTFDLRRNVRFHDGTPFDADAVVYSFERQRSPNHPAHFTAFPYWENSFKQIIVEIRKINSHKVQIRIARPYSPFLASLAMFSLAIVSPTALAKQGRGFASHPVGTGPYRFVSWSKGKRIVLARNDHYWGEKPSIDTLVYTVESDPSHRLMALQSGAVDVVHGLEPEDRRLVKLHPDLRLYTIPGNNVSYLAMNTAHAPFNDRRIRQAVNHAINKEALVKFTFQGLAIPAKGPIPPSMWSYHHDLVGYHYDPKKARQLLDEAGFDYTQRLRLFVMATSRVYLPSPVLAARMIAQYLSDVGMEIELVIQPHGDHLQSLRMGKHDLCLLGWAGDNGDPDNFLYVLLDKENARLGTAQNVAFYQNETVHQFLRRAQTTIERSLREKLYRDVQEIIAEEAPWVPLAHTEVVVAARRSVKNLHVHPSHAVWYSQATF